MIELVEPNRKSSIILFCKIFLIIIEILIKKINDTYMHNLIIFSLDFSFHFESLAEEIGPASC